MKKIIGVAGLRHSGKTAFRKCLQEVENYEYNIFPNIAYISYSDILAQILDILSLPKNRPNFEKLSTHLENTIYDTNVLTNAILALYKDALNPLIVIEGIRFPYQYLDIKHTGKMVDFIYLKCPVQERYQRMINDNPSSEAVLKDNPQVSLDEYEQGDQYPTEILIPSLEAFASQDGILYENTGTLDDLKLFARNIISKHLV